MKENITKKLSKLSDLIENIAKLSFRLVVVFFFVGLFISFIMLFTYNEETGIKIFSFIFRVSFILLTTVLLMHLCINSLRLLMRFRWKTTDNDMMAKDIFEKLNRWLVTKGMWRDYALFRKVIVEGIYPMHPISTFMLTQLSDYLQNRSSLTLISQYIENSKEVDISDLVRYLPIDDSKLWCDEILKLDLHRKNVYDDICKSGFDIEKSAEKIVSVYQDMLKGRG